MNKHWLISLIALAAISSMSLPISAKPDNDTVTIQEATQDSTITGNHNYVDQGNTQVNVNNANQRRSSSGNTQRSHQITDIWGNNNASSQDNYQINVNSNRSQRPPRTSVKTSY